MNDMDDSVNDDYVCSVCTYNNCNNYNDDGKVDDSLISCVMCNELLPHYIKRNNDDNKNSTSNNHNNDGNTSSNRKRMRVSMDSLQGLSNSAKKERRINDTSSTNNITLSPIKISCHHCTYINNVDKTLDIDKIDCEMCEKSISIVTNACQQDKGNDSGKVTCLNCTFGNDSSNKICEICNDLLPHKYPSPTSSSSSSSSSSSAKGLFKYFGNQSSTQQYSEEALSASIAFNSDSATDGIIQLLERALRKTGSTFRLCSPFTHISQIGVEIGAKWSCGYRNIQMMCTALMQVPACKAKLFNGDGDIPDVYGLQSWIEKAWADGFDPLGCDQLGGSLMGTDIWIGATECAALLRYFGLKAEVVDFSIYAGNSSKQLSDRLISWIKTYFEYCKRNGGLIFPLYFQHDGHSRTIVGYEEAQAKTNILIFDPVSSGKTIKQKLLNYISDVPNSSWQVMMKRGLHTMAKKEYQIVYIDAIDGDGILSPQLRQIAKTIVGISDTNSKIALSRRN